MSAAVAAARAAIGARFRLHGRDPATGLDCVGLVALALGEDAVPSGYAMRGGDPARIAALIDACGLARAQDAQAGDLLLCASGPGQLHLAIDSGTGVIHADAVLRRVVERPGPVPWRVLGRWRQAGED
ncbi:MAG: hypothetical protein C0476_06975 [Sphingomonas sp.]|nr:hypothetical protein [Sphingomonas sp.]